MEVYSYSSELVHHGIKGMKWGVRRYQNTDGSLTPAGKKRQERLENSRSHTMASSTIANAKFAAVSGISAFGIAAAGSVATSVLSKKGKTQAAIAIYKMSRKAFNETVFASQISLGASVVSGLMTSRDSMKDYLSEERRIKKKYKK